jgi:hypothetical protein
MHSGLKVVDVLVLWSMCPSVLCILCCSFGCGQDCSS